jgi:hypothetical protein
MNGGNNNNNNNNNNSGLSEDALRRVCEKVLGWLPKRAQGGDAGLEVKRRYQEMADAFEARKGEKIMAAVGGAKGAVEKDEAKVLAQKRADTAESKARAEAEALELLGCGPMAETLVVGEVVEGSAAMAAGLQVGQKVLSVGGQPVASFRALLDVLVARCRDKVTETDPEAAAEEEAADERAKARGKKPKNRGQVLPRDVEVLVELSGGNTGLFWDKLLPALEGYWQHGRDHDDDQFTVPRKYVQQFPYNENEVDRVLSSFKDPWGPVTTELEECFFRRCGCLDDKGKRRVCVPPAPGYMCTRKALLLKVEVKLQRQKDAYDEKQRQAEEVAAVEEIARKVCGCGIQPL